VPTWPSATTRPLLFFGSLGLVAAIGTWSIDRKRRLEHGVAWNAYAYRTSSIHLLQSPAAGNVFWCGRSELKRPDAMRAGLHAAVSIARVARLDVEAAGIMLLYRREDFLSGAWSRELTAEAERLGAQAKDGLDGLTRRLFGKLKTAHRQVTSFATLGVPYAAVRRFVGKGEPPPPLVDRLITNAYGAVMAEERPRGLADG
jgi:hypothetical protein